MNELIELAIVENIVTGANLEKSEIFKLVSAVKSITNRIDIEKNLIENFDNKSYYIPLTHYIEHKFNKSPILITNKLTIGRISDNKYKINKGMYNDKLFLQGKILFELYKNNTSIKIEMTDDYILLYLS